MQKCMPRLFLLSGAGYLMATVKSVRRRGIGHLLYFFGNAGLGILLFFLTLPTFLVAQGEKREIPVESLLQIIKTRSVHSKLTNWMEVEPAFRLRLNKAQSDDGKLNAFVYLFGRMNDVHSAIFYKNQAYGYYKGVDEETA